MLRHALDEFPMSENSATAKPLYAKWDEMRRLAVFGRESWTRYKKPCCEIARIEIPQTRNKKTMIQLTRETEDCAQQAFRFPSPSKVCRVSEEGRSKLAAILNKPNPAAEYGLNYPTAEYSFTCPGCCYRCDHPKAAIHFSFELVFIMSTMTDEEVAVKLQSEGIEKVPQNWNWMTRWTPRFWCNKCWTIVQDMTETKSTAITRYADTNTWYHSQKGQVESKEIDIGELFNDPQIHSFQESCNNSLDNPNVQFRKEFLAKLDIDWDVNYGRASRV